MFFRTRPRLEVDRGSSKGRGQGPHLKSLVCSTGPQMKILLGIVGHLVENLVIMCWFYVKNCIFEHTTNKIFRCLPVPLGDLSPYCPQFAIESYQNAKAQPYVCLLLDLKPDKDQRC